jgi:hypothetical protein
MHTSERKGGVADGVALLIWSSCIVTFVVAVVGPDHLSSYGTQPGWNSERGGWYFDGPDVDPSFWFRNALAIGLAIYLAAICLPRSSLSRSVRGAVLLPVAHAVMLIAAAVVWPTISEQLSDLRHWAPLADALPMIWVAGGAALLCLAGGWLVAPRQRGEWLHATVLLALATLLLVGLVLPLATTIVRHGVDEYRPFISLEKRLATPVWRLVAVLVPPFVVALGFTLAVMRWPAFVRRHRSRIMIGIYMLVAVAASRRISGDETDARIYANFIHVLLALALVAVGALGLLAASIAVRDRRAERRLARDPAVVSGEVALDCDDVAADARITSWLRGPQSRLRPFTVVTPKGSVPITGAELVVPLPLASTQLRVGESIETLRAGDRVVVAGLVEPDASHPFRDSAALIPGTSGVVVKRAGVNTSRFTDVALALWRPCLAYCTITMVVAALALAGIVSW